MGISLRNITKKISDLVVQNDDAIRKGQSSLAAGNKKIQQLPNNSHGVLASPQARQQFVQQNQAPQFNLAKSTLASLYDTTVGIGKAAYNTVDVPVQVAKVGMGNLTNNQTAANNARQQISLRGDNTLLAPVTKFERKVAGAITAPIAEKAMKQQEEYARRVGGEDAALAARQEMLDYQLSKGGLDRNTNVAKDTSIDAGLTAFTLATFGSLPKVSVATKGAKVADSPALPKVSPEIPSTPVVKPKAPEGQGTKPMVVIKQPAATLPESKLPTVAPKSPNVVQKMFTSTRGELDRMGTGGKEVATRLQAWRNRSEIGQQAFLDSVPSVQNLGREFPDFVGALDDLSRGKTPAMSPKVAQAVKEWSENITKIPEQAVAAGKNVGNRGKYYFPREYSELFKNRNSYNAAVNHLVSSGQVKTKAEAIQALQFMKSERKFGNFREREFDIPGYDKTPEALSRYVAGAYDDIAKAEQFGPNGEISSQLLARIAEEGHDAVRATRNLDIALGNVDKSTMGHKVSGRVRQVNSLRSLSTAGLSNATQLPVNTGTIAGFSRTLKGATKAAVSKQSRAEARETGVLLNSVIDNLATQSQGVNGVITRNIASPFFRQIEKFNRQATAIVGKDWGNALAKKAANGNQKALRTLQEKLGVTGEIGPKLTREQEIQASRGLVERAQFKVDPQDLPGWVDSPLGKLVAQFRTFGYKQSDFMYNQVLREAMEGNFLPLGRFIAIGVPAGTVTLATKGAIKGVRYTEPDENEGSKAAKAIAAVGGFGVPGMEGQNLYKSVQYGNTPAAIVGTVGGVTASAIYETSENIRTGQRTGDWTKLKKEGLRNIPAVGPSIANRKYPKKPYQPDENKKLAEKQNLQTSSQVEANPPKGYTLQEVITSKGKNRYAYTLDDGDVQYTKDLKSAQRAIAKDAFAKSDKKELLTKDRYWYKDEGGEVHYLSRATYDKKLAAANKKKVGSSKSKGGRRSTASGGSTHKYDLKLSKGSISAPKVSVKYGKLKSKKKVAMGKPKVSIKKSLA